MLPLAALIPLVAVVSMLVTLAVVAVWDVTRDDTHHPR